MSAMPDVHAAVQNIYEALRPGGHFLVFDVRLDRGKTARIPVRLLAVVYRALAGATGVGAQGALRGTFDAVEVLPRSGETIVIAVAGEVVTHGETFRAG